MFYLMAMIIIVSNASQIVINLLPQNYCEVRGYYSCLKGGELGQEIWTTEAYEHFEISEICFLRRMSDFVNLIYSKHKSHVCQM